MKAEKDMGEVNDTKKSKAELAAIAGGYIDTWRAAMVEGMGAMATLLCEGEWMGAVEPMAKEMKRRFPDLAPQEIERRKL